MGNVNPFNPYNSYGLNNVSVYPQPYPTNPFGSPYGSPFDAQYGQLGYQQPLSPYSFSNPAFGMGYTQMPYNYGYSDQIGQSGTMDMMMNLMSTLFNKIFDQLASLRSQRSHTPTPAITLTPTATPAPTTAATPSSTPAPTTASPTLTAPTGTSPLTQNQYSRITDYLTQHSSTISSGNTLLLRLQAQNNPTQFMATVQQLVTGGLITETAAHELTRIAGENRTYINTLTDQVNNQSYPEGLTPTQANQVSQYFSHINTIPAADKTSLISLAATNPKAFLIRLDDMRENGQLSSTDEASFIAIVRNQGVSTANLTDTTYNQVSEYMNGHMSGLSAENKTALLQKARQNPQAFMTQLNSLKEAGLVTAAEFNAVSQK